MLRENEDLLYSPAMRLPKELRSFLGYYRRFFKQSWEALWGFWKQQVVLGVVIGGMSVVLQIQSGLISKELSGAAVAAFIIPFLAVVVVSFLFQAVRTPWLLDKKRDEEIAELDKKLLTATGYVPGGVKAVEEKIKIDESYKWLHEMADKQAQRIQDFAELQRVVIGDARLDDPVPHIIFGLDIINKSVFNLAVDEKVEGYIEFRGKRLAAPLLVLYSAKEIPPNQNAGITIEQRLTKEEAEYIVSSENAHDANFYFDALTVMIRGGIYAQQVQPQKLVIRKGVHISGEPTTYRF